jgi:hypothetical protein
LSSVCASYVFRWGNRSIELLTTASDAGILAAKAELGRIVYHGLGVTADRAKGRHLLEEAASEGNQTAKTYLASLDKSFQIDFANVQFIAGIFQYLGEKNCKITSAISDRLDLEDLAANGVSSLLEGSDYFNPNIGDRSMLGSAGLFAAGAKFVEQIPCDSSLASYMAERLVAASRSNKGGDDLHPKLRQGLRSGTLRLPDADWPRRRPGHLSADISSRDHPRDHKSQSAAGADDQPHVPDRKLLTRRVVRLSEALAAPTASAATGVKIHPYETS